jgi:hypothetical protein
LGIHSCRLKSNLNAGGSSQLPAAMDGVIKM